MSKETKLTMLSKELKDDLDEIKDLVDDLMNHDDYYIIASFESLDRVEYLLDIAPYSYNTNNKETIAVCDDCNWFGESEHLYNDIFHDVSCPVCTSVEVFIEDNNQPVEDDDKPIEITDDTTMLSDQLKADLEYIEKTLNSKSDNILLLNSGFTIIEVFEKVKLLLNIAPFSYKEKTDVNEEYSECDNCGWFGNVKYLSGGTPNCDGGDCNDVYCPVCNNPDIE